MKYFCKLSKFPVNNFRETYLQTFHHNILSIALASVQLSILYSCYEYTDIIQIFKLVIQWLVKE